MSKELEVLEAARDLIRDPSHWTKGALARDANGKAVGTNRGVCFCTLGALTRATVAAAPEGVGDREWFELHDSAETIFRTQLIKTYGYNSIARFNDMPHITHDDVMAVFDSAISKLRELQGEQK